MSNDTQTTNPENGSVAVQDAPEREEQTFDEAFDEIVNTPEIDDSDSSSADKPEHNDNAEQDAPDETEQPTKSVDELVAEMQRERDEWRQKYRSNDGRISAYQREVENLRDQLSSQETQLKDAYATRQSLNEKDWEQVKQDFPEFADAMDKRVEQQIRQRVNQELEQRMLQLNDRIIPIEERNQQVAMQYETAMLEKDHPDWRSVVQSDHYRQWLEYQPEPVQELMHSPAASDAAYLLNSYKTSAGITQERDQKERRQSTLAASVAAPRGARTRQTPAAEDDFDSAWEAATSMR